MYYRVNPVARKFCGVKSENLVVYSLLYASVGGRSNQNGNSQLHPRSKGVARPSSAWAGLSSLCRQPPFHFGNNRTMTGPSKRDAVGNSAVVGAKNTGAQACNVALLGFGTVGSSVARILCERSHNHF